MNLSLSELIPEINLNQSRQPLTSATFSRVLLPAFLCYYATAYLVIAQNTLSIRVALLPITLWSLFRACTEVDVVAGHPEYDRMVYLNQGLVIVAVTMAFRASIWTFQLEPYCRVKASSSRCLDALDLAFNLRGVGWTWSAGLKLPKETRNTSSRSQFLVHTTISFLFNFLAFDISHYSAQRFGPDTIGTALGGSIHDSSLPLPLSLIRSFALSGLAGTTIYFSINAAYQFATVVGILLLQQSPLDWPPLFGNPFTATSVSDFWGRWHQLFRQCFIELGGKPMTYLMGRVGGVLGVFFVSGVLHYLGLWGMARGSDFGRAAGFFILQGVGIILEYAFRSVFGSRVKGLLGWLWTCLWVMGWGVLVTEAWSLRGLIGSMFFPEEQRPATIIIEHITNLWKGI